MDQFSSTLGDEIIIACIPVNRALHLILPQTWLDSTFPFLVEERAESRQRYGLADTAHY